MEWLHEITLQDGEKRELQTTWGSLTLCFEGDMVTYQRGPLFENEDEPVEKRFILENLEESVQLSLLPVYPDRPVIFKLEDELAIPPGENGFFFVSLTIGVGVRIKSSDTIMEPLRPRPYKNSYWGPPHDGLLCYQVRSRLSTEARSLVYDTDRTIVVVPIYYQNRRTEGETVERCLVPLDELDLYRTPEGDLVFEVVRLTQQEEFYQEPEPLKRTPHELKSDLEFFQTAPGKAQSLFEKVRKMPRLDAITNVFLNR